MQHQATHHVMIDTETLGLTPGCVVRTVSLVEFNPADGEVIRRKNWVINLQDSFKCGFRIEAGTLKWWLMRSDEARKAFVATSEEEVSYVSFVNEFTNWFEPYNHNVVLWGLQLDFDTAVIRSYLGYFAYNIMRRDSYEVPWNRKRMVEMRPYMEAYQKLHSVTEEAPHVSMDDCMRQIQALVYVLNHQQGLKLQNINLLN